MFIRFHWDLNFHILLLMPDSESSDLICRFPHGKSRTSAPTMQLIISSKYGVQRIPSDRWSKHAAGTWPCFQSFFLFCCFIRLLQVSMTTSRSACQLFNSMAPKHLTQVIVDMITLVPPCLHTNATEQSASAIWRTLVWAVRLTHNDTQSSRTSAPKSEKSDYGTVLLQCLRVSTSKKKVTLFPFVCWSGCCQLQGNPFT